MKAVRTMVTPGQAGQAAGRWLLLTLMSGWLVSCAGTGPDAGPGTGGGTEAGGSFGPGYPPGSASWSGEAQAAYRTAFMAGMQDQREGYRFDDDRGALVLDVEHRGFYRQGYRTGYYHDAAVRRQERKAQQAARDHPAGEAAPDAVKEGP